MNSFLKFFIIITWANLLRLRAHPINQYDELPCTTEDDIQLRPKRSAVTSKNRIWPNSTVPYFLACTDFNEEELNLLKNSLDEIQQKTCIKFIEMKVLGKYRNYINVECKPKNGCRSALGYQRGKQILNLKLRRENTGPGGCMIKRKIQHEFMHALGFHHEHNSPVRDQYVKILSRNIAKGMNNYFKKSKSKEFGSYGCPYDYDSIMQVDSYRHSKSKDFPSILPLNKQISLDDFGKAKSVSECDIKRINNMYCNGGES